MLESVLKAVLRRLYGWADRWLDWRDRVDTAAPLAKSEFRANSENRQFAIQYLPADRPLLRRTFRAFPYEPSDFTFVDVGCGRGRAVLGALRHGFAHVVGIELESALAEAARTNIATFAAARGISPARAQIVNADVESWEFPATNLFVFLYNPFHETMMRKLVARLEAWIDANGSSHRLVVAYMNPVHGYLFQDSPAFRELTSLRKLVTVYPADGFPVVLFENR